jgi:hypothetical protein
LIQVCRIDFSVGFLPTKQLAVKIKDPAPVFSQQLVPAHAAQFVQPAGLPLAIRQSGDQRKSRLLRIGDHRNSADIAVRWRQQGSASKTPDLRGRRIDVIDGDVADPSRGCPQSPPLFRELH